MRRAQAECRKSSILSVILDGMDQSKTDLPHFLGWNNPNVSNYYLHINGIYLLISLTLSPSGYLILCGMINKFVEKYYKLKTIELSKVNQKEHKI